MIHHLEMCEAIKFIFPLNLKKFLTILAYRNTVAQKFQVYCCRIKTYCYYIKYDLNMMHVKVFIFNKIMQDF